MKTDKGMAVVTGASSGIGLAISRELASRGYSLVMVSNEKDRLQEEALNTGKEFNIKTYTLCMDLAQKNSAQELFDFCFKENSFKVEILVNNAGIFYFLDVIDTPAEKIETIINLHINTPAMLCRLFARKMIEDNIKGYILNMTSVSSRMMMPGIAMYCGTKGFLRCFSHAMRHEVIERGVSITAISPGAVATNLYNLPQRYLKLGMNLGVILHPQRLAKIAVKKMFKRKAEYIPSGFINRFFVMIVVLLPEPLIQYIRRRLSKNS